VASTTYELDEEVIDSPKFVLKTVMEILFFSATIDEHLRLAEGMLRKGLNYSNTTSKDEEKYSFSATFDRDIEDAVKKISTNVSNWAHELSSSCLLASKLMDRRDCFNLVEKNHSNEDGSSAFNKSQRISNRSKRFDWSSPKRFPSLAELYLSYRDIMDHWDNVLQYQMTWKGMVYL